MEYFEEIPEEERKTYISQFEKMLRSPDIKYYDIHVYEEFTEYFLDHGQIELAVLCVEKGLMLFPYNVELKVLQAECFYLDKNYSKLKTATLDLLAKGFRYREVPISYHFRTTGESFIKLGRYLSVCQVWFVSKFTDIQNWRQGNFLKHGGFSCN